MDTLTQLTEVQKKFRTTLVVVAFILFTIFVLGMFFIAVSDLEKSAILTLSFVAGLSMIFLPCTLPLVFIVVPLALGGNPKKGFFIALLFGLGLSITLSIYGVAIALLGGWLGLTTATEYMFLVAGLAALVFGLAELKFIKLKIPGYGGKLPDFIQTQGDYLKSFLLGLFLGNAGVGCPNPAFYILLGYIATVGNPVEGWYLGFIHGVGRAIPLIFLAILAILGVSATGWVTKQKEKVERFIGWALVYIGAFIFMNGAFGHEWYVQSGLHGAWEKAIAWTFDALGFLLGVAGLGGKFGELIEHTHDVISSPFYRAGNWVMVALFSVPLIWNYFIKKKELKTLAAQEPRDETLLALKRTELSRLFFKYLIVIAVLAYLFISFFPSTVLPEEHKEAAHLENITRVSGGYDRVIDLHNYVANVQLSAENPPAGVPFGMSFTILDKATNAPIRDLEITHERPMHVVLAREDLNNFSHVHPELKGDSYVLTHTFAEEGYYKGWADFTYKGETHIVDFLIDTQNPQRTQLTPDFSTEKDVNGYQVTLAAPSVIEKGKSAELDFRITKEEKEAALSKFLGAPGHLVAISEDLSDFIHTHAEEGVVGRHDPLLTKEARAHVEEQGVSAVPTSELHYAAVFNQAGIYKLWMQTVVDGREFTADFMIRAQ